MFVAALLVCAPLTRSNADEEALNAEEVLRNFELLEKGQVIEQNGKRYESLKDFAQALEGMTIHGSGSVVSLVSNPKRAKVTILSVRRGRNLDHRQGHGEVCRHAGPWYMEEPPPGSRPVLLGWGGRVHAAVTIPHRSYRIQAASAKGRVSDGPAFLYPAMQSVALCLWQPSRVHLWHPFSPLPTTARQPPRPARTGRAPETQ